VQIQQSSDVQDYIFFYSVSFILIVASLSTEIQRNAEEEDE
jgi:hypothetical protein